MTQPQTLDLTTTTLDDPDCRAAELLHVFDAQGEAFMLNALHTLQPTFDWNGTAVLSDMSAIAYLPRSGCYAFGVSVEQSIQREKAIRRSRFGMPLLDPLADETDDWPLPLDLTIHRVMAYATTLVARETGTDLPDTFTPHAGLFLQMAPNAPETLNDILHDSLRDPDDNLLNEKLDEILELLARRLIKITPSHQMAVFRTAVQSLGPDDRQPSRRRPSVMPTVTPNRPGRLPQQLANIAQSYVQTGDFRLASGARSSWYIDARAFLLQNEVARTVGRIMVPMLEPGVTCVGGPSTGAIPLAMAIITQSQHSMTAFFVRPEEKQHGSGLRIEGNLAPRVAVIDDTCTTGASILDAIRAVEQAGATVEQVLTLFHRGGHDAINRAGYQYQYAMSVIEP